MFKAEIAVRGSEDELKLYAYKVGHFKIRNSTYLEGNWELCGQKVGRYMVAQNLTYLAVTINLFQLQHQARTLLPRESHSAKGK